MTEPATYMAMRCPTSDRSRYDCKVAEACSCGKDDDLYTAFERQCAWKAKRPVDARDWEAT